MILAALIRGLPVVIVAAIWEALPRLGLIDPQMLPSLGQVLVAWAHLAWSGDLAYHAAASLANWAAGLVLGIAVGTALGTLMATYPAVNATVGPLLQMTYPIPRSALIPVMIIWFGLGAGAKIASIFSGTLLPVVLAAYNGARGVDEALLWSARALGANRAQLLAEIILPASLPDILAGVRSAVAIAFVLMVTSELLIGQRGLGYLIGFLGDSGLYPDMFAVVLTVAALGFAVDRLYLFLMQWLLQWRG